MGNLLPLKKALDEIRICAEQLLDAPEYLPYFAALQSTLNATLYELEAATTPGAATDAQLAKVCEHARGARDAVGAVLWYPNTETKRNFAVDHTERLLKAISAYKALPISQEPSPQV